MRYQKKNKARESLTSALLWLCNIKNQMRKGLNLKRLLKSLEKIIKATLQKKKNVM